jgi:hypothetical protein
MDMRDLDGPVSETHSGSPQFLGLGSMMQREFICDPDTAMPFLIFRGDESRGAWLDSTCHDPPNHEALSRSVFSDITAR